MMPNELIFIIQSLFLASTALAAAVHGATALTAFMCICAIIENLLVTKQIDVCGFTITSCDAYAVGCTIALSFLQEYYGHEKARRAIWLSFASLIFFACISQLHLLFTPSSIDSSHHHFLALFSSSPRIVLASLTAYLISQYTERFLYAYLARRFDRSSLFHRLCASSLVSQAIDTALFTYLGLYGIANHLWDIFFISYLIKVGVIALMSPLSSLVVFIKPTVARRHEPTV
jgi:uncharacterized integral membrane protein (TIGR00697 family)